MDILEDIAIKFKELEIENLETKIELEALKRDYQSLRALVETIADVIEYQIELEQKESENLELLNQLLDANMGN